MKIEIAFNIYNIFGESFTQIHLDSLKDFIVIFILIIWEVYWKYKALWLSAKNSHRGWFISILIINSCALLPIYYLYKNNYFKK